MPTYLDRPNPRKIIEAITWLLSQGTHKSRIEILKWLYFADKYFLQKFGRPIFGDRYVHLDFGPVASFAYDILKEEKKEVPVRWLQAAANAFGYKKRGRNPFYFALRPPDMDFFSEAELQSMKLAADFCAKAARDGRHKGKSAFNISDASHEERAWQATSMKETLDFEMIMDDHIANRQELIRRLHAYAKQPHPSYKDESVLWLSEKDQDSLRAALQGSAAPNMAKYHRLLAPFERSPSEEG